MMARGDGERRGDRILAVMLAAVLAFAVAPLLVLAVFSVNDYPYYSLPFRGFTTHWYGELAANERLASGLRVSVEIALLTGVAGTVLGTTFALGLARLRGRRAGVALGIGLLPLVTPALVLAIGSQLLFVQAGVPLSLATVVIADATAFTPFVILIVMTRLASFDWRLVAAARDLGAGPWSAFRHTVLPAALPAIISGFLVATLLSFSDFVIGFFTGRGFFTLPSLIYSMQRVGISPDLLAYSTVVVVAAAVAAVTARAVLVTLTARRGGGDASA